MNTTEIYAYYKARSRCVQCHKQDAYTLNGRAYCYDCMRLNHTYSRKSYYNGAGQRRQEKKREKAQQLRDQKRCTYCGKKLPDGHPYIRCDSCRARFRNYKRKEISARTGFQTGDARQRWKYGQCYKCGAPLKTGLNSHGEPYRVCETCYQDAIRALRKANRVNQERGNEHHLWTKENAIAFNAMAKYSLRSPL